MIFYQFGIGFMWCGSMKYIICFLLIVSVMMRPLSATHHYYPDQQSSFQVYTQLYFNKFIFGVKVHAAITKTLSINTRFVFFNLHNVGLVSGFQVDRMGYDRKFFGFSGPKNRMFVDVYQ